MNLFSKTTHIVAGMWFATFFVPSILYVIGVPQIICGPLMFSLAGASTVYSLAAIFKSI